MIVNNEQKLLLLYVREPGEILAAIPTARVFPAPQGSVVAVPHNLDEVCVLRNLGYSPPSPTQYYHWPARHGITPLQAQRETVAAMTENKRFFCNNDMGTGKTLSALWAFDYLHALGKARRALVVSPLSTLDRVWGDHLFEHLHHLKFVVLHGTHEKRMKLLQQDADVYIINHDGVALPRRKAREQVDTGPLTEEERTRRERAERALASRRSNADILVSALRDRDDIDTVIVDELSAFRNAQTHAWNGLDKIIRGKNKPRAYVWGMTGTPMPNDPTDVYGQIKLIRPGAVPAYYKTWRDQVMYQAGETWLPRSDALETVHMVMQPAIRFAREECVDLPPTTVTTLHAEMSAEQTRVYKEMRTKFKLEFDADQIVAANEAVRRTKLLQIGCGIIYGNGETYRVHAPERVKLVREIIHEAPAKVIVFVPFTEAVKYVAEELAEDFTVEIIEGGVSKSERDQIFTSFQHGKDPRVLVAQPVTMSHGLTLTAAATIIWYAPAPSSEVYVQANNRITRPGQALCTSIVHVESNDIDRRSFTRLQNKEKLQGLLLQLFAEQ